MIIGILARVTGQTFVDYFKKLINNRIKMPILQLLDLRSLKSGDPVNLEVDVIAKYVEKMIGAEKAKSLVTIEKLVRAGF